MNAIKTFELSNPTVCMPGNYSQVRRDNCDTSHAFSLETGTMGAWNAANQISDDTYDILYEVSHAVSRSVFGGLRTYIEDLL